ncbi:MAG: signal peptidase I [Pseudomonadota bacterium]|nr:signal peptidase I [Pseudomonadota bacterium]
MSDTRVSSAVNPWFALWFRPRAAIDAALARGPGATPLLIAVAAALFGAITALADNAALEAAWPGPRTWIVAAAAAAIIVALAVVGYYLNGWLLNAAAHLFAGRGTARATRAAVAWSVVPLLAVDLVVLASVWMWPGSAAPAGWQVAMSGVRVFASLWSLGLALSMLGHVQGFDGYRAFAALLIGSLLPALVIALLVRAFLLQPFNTPSGSMAPTLLNGDYVFAGKADYGYGRYSFPFDLFSFRGRILGHAPARGDVVVFRHNDQDWVKRIVGLPGETVQLQAGRLYIDGQMIERRAVAPDPDLLDALGKPMTAPTYEEQLPGGAAHLIVQLHGDDGPGSNTKPFDIPQDSYFVLGDNRDNSTDSRMAGVGFVAFDDLIGRADLIFFSRADAPPRPRFDRVGTRVR